MPSNPPQCNQADGNGDERSDRRCESHRIQCFREIAAGEPCERYARYHDRDAVVQERQPGQSAGAEETAAAEMDTGDHAVQHIALHILGSEPDNLCLISKEGDGGTGSKLHGNCDDQPERKCDADRVAQRLTGTLRFSGAQVLSGEGGNRGEKRGWNQKQDSDQLFNDSDRRRII